MPLTPKGKRGASSAAEGGGGGGGGGGAAAGVLGPEGDPSQLEVCSVHAILVAGMQESSRGEGGGGGGGGGLGAAAAAAGGGGGGHGNILSPTVPPGGGGGGGAFSVPPLALEDAPHKAAGEEVGGGPPGSASGETWESLMRQRGETEPDQAVTGIVALYDSHFVAYMESSESGLSHAVGLARALIANKTSNLLRFRVVFTCLNLRERLFPGLFARRFSPPAGPPPSPRHFSASPTTGGGGGGAFSFELAPNAQSSIDASAGGQPSGAGAGVGVGVGVGVGGSFSSSFSHSLSGHRNPRESFIKTMLHLVMTIRAHSTMSLKKALDLVGEKHSGQCLPSAPLVEAVLAAGDQASSSTSDAAAAAFGPAAASSPLLLDEDVVWPAPTESFLLNVSDY